MATKQLPRFVIYQPNAKEFHICLEAKGDFLRWCSFYSPTPDPRYFREVKRIDNIPVKELPKKQIIDKGTYMVTRNDDKESAEEKLLDGIDKKNFALILNGKKLKGRFAFKHVVGGTILQKYKDKYAVEEDVLSNDLSRTIKTMIPDYDEKKIKLTRKNSHRNITQQPVKSASAEHEKNKKENETSSYNFTFYHSSKRPDVCVVTDVADGTLVLIFNSEKWVEIKPMKRISAKKKNMLIQKAESLSTLKK